MKMYLRAAPTRHVLRAHAQCNAPRHDGLLFRAKPPASRGTGAHRMRVKIILKLMKRFAADVRGSALHGERNQPNSQQCEGSGAAALGAVGKALTLQTVAAPKFRNGPVHDRCAHTTA